MFVKLFHKVHNKLLLLKSCASLSKNKFLSRKQIEIL
jgi:hypothetical protein